MKLSVCHRWVHPICVMFTCELTVDDNMRACNLDALNPERETLVCMVCRNKSGSSIQCSAPGCLVSAHAYCAFATDFQMTLHEAPVQAQRTNSDDVNPGTDGGDYMTLQYKMYCVLHFNQYAHDHTLISCRDRYYLEHLERQRQKSKETAATAAASNNDDNHNNGNVRNIIEKASPQSQLLAEVGRFVLISLCFTLMCTCIYV